MPLRDDTTTILVVEDEALLLDVMIGEFEDAGFKTISAGNGEAALAVMRGAAVIDLLFTDVRLPGALDGWTLAEMARVHRPDLPVIYATGFTHNPPRGVDHSRFFIKPYRPSAILRAVRELMPSPVRPAA